MKDGNKTFNQGCEELEKIQSDKIVTFTENPIKKDFKAESRKHQGDLKKEEKKKKVK